METKWVAAIENSTGIPIVPAPHLNLTVAQNIAQGDDITQRTGNTVFFTALEAAFNCSLHPSNPPGTKAEIRLVIYYPYEASVNYQPATLNNPSQIDTFFIFYDKTFHLIQGANATKHISYKKGFTKGGLVKGLRALYANNNGNSINRYDIRVAVLCDVTLGATQPTIDGYIRLFFKDA